MSKVFVKPKGLPQRAFEVWEEVFNANKKKVGDERAAKIAWSAVKKGWKKVNDKWVRKKASEIKLPHKFKGSVTDLIGLDLDPANKNSSEIEILKVGTWDHPLYGELSITQQRLNRFKQNFDDGIRKAVAIDVEHKTDEGAVGWVKAVTIKDDSLFALVEWTNEGIQLIRNKKYRFFSPEFDDFYEDAKTSREFRDVLIGGAITNRPFLQELEEIVLSEKFTEKIKKQKGGEKNKKIMNKKELKKKLLADPDFVPKKSDKVSKKMLVEVRGVIKAEAKAAKNKKLSKKGGRSKKDKKVKTITLTENQLDKLETAANEGVKAMRTVRRMRLKEIVKGFKYSEDKNPKGTLTPKSAKLAGKLLYTLGKNQRKLFTEFVKGLPKVKLLKELGVDVGIKESKTPPKGVDSYSWQLSERANALREAKPKKYKKYIDALEDAEKELKTEGIKAE